MPAVAETPEDVEVSESVEPVEIDGTPDEVVESTNEAESGLGTEIADDTDLSEDAVSETEPEDIEVSEDSDTGVQDAEVEAAETNSETEANPKAAPLVRAQRGASGGIAPLATGDGCSYADPNSGTYASTLCWLNLEQVTTLYSVNETVVSCEEQSRIWPFNDYRYRCRVTGRYESVLGATYGGPFTATNVQGAWSGYSSTQAVARTEAERNARQAARNATNALWSSSGDAPVYGPVTNYPIEFQLSNTYVFRASVNILGQGEALGLEATAFPTWGTETSSTGAFLGRNGFYTGVAGKPALYHANDAGGKTTTISLANVRVQPVGATGNADKVTGFSVVVADAESTDQNESISWSYSGSDGFLWLPNNPAAWAAAGNNTARKNAAVGSASYAGTNVNLWPQLSNGLDPSGNPVSNPAYLANTVTVSSNNSASRNGTAMLQISPNSSSPNSSFNVTQAMKGGGKQAVAFGVMLAGAKVNVEVDDRILDGMGAASTTDFGAQITAPSYDPIVVQTGPQSLLETTGDQSFPLAATGSMQLSFSEITPTNDPLFDSYKSSWACFKSTPASSTQTPWPGNGGVNPPAPDASWARLKGGESIECTVTYTPPYITLKKTIDTSIATAAPNVPGDWQLTATSNLSAAVALGDTDTKMPVAVGNYSMTEGLVATAAEWEHGYTWRDLSCDTTTPALQTDPLSGAITLATVDVTKGSNTVCSFENQANRPQLVASKAADPASGEVIAAGDDITYSLVFDNTDGTAPQALTDQAGSLYVDHLADVLDDASLLDAAGAVTGEGAGDSDPEFTYDIHTQTSPSPTHDVQAHYDSASERITFTGTVPAYSKVVVSFKVRVKDNDTDVIERQEGAAANTNTPLVRGYQLNNYLTKAEADTETLTKCDVVSDGCVTHSVRAWTVEKSSQPLDGASVHAGANNYYRVKITNYSGEALADITLEDDMTSTLFAGVFDPTAPNAVPYAYGISYYSANNDLLGGEYWNVDAGGPVPKFSNPQATADPSDPEYDPTQPFGGTWTLTVSDIEIPSTAGAANTPVEYAIVGYPVEIGKIADPTNPMQPYSAQGQSLPAAPNATWVNTAAASTASVGTTVNIEPNRCRVSDLTSGAMKPGWDDALTDEENFGDCKTYHSLDESFFHLWKQSTAKNPSNPTQVQSNLLGSYFVLSDTKADAQNAGGPVPSKWLCRADNFVEFDASGEVTNGAAPAGQGVGEPDWGFGSKAHQSLIDANNARTLWNNSNPMQTPKDLLPMCGIFYQHTAEHAAEDSDGQPAGSWHAEDVRGGDAIDWRENPNGDGHGIYWLTETVSPTDHQLLAEPMQLWVAPDLPTPEHLDAGDRELYDYQGRLSMPVLGEGEAFSPDPDGVIGGVNGSSDIRQTCRYGPWTLPPNSQPACVMPTGWTMPIFDAKLAPLPHTGGIGAGWLAAGGTLVSAIAIGAAWWWRRRRHKANALDSQLSNSLVSQ